MRWPKEKGETSNMIPFALPVFVVAIGLFMYLFLDGMAKLVSALLGQRTEVYRYDKDQQKQLDESLADLKRRVDTLENLAKRIKAEALERIRDM
jgi:hypothetical protein